MVRALIECLRQVDWSIEALVLERSSAGLTSRVRSSTARGIEDLEIEPDAGVLIAARQRLPIILIESGVDQVTEMSRPEPQGTPLPSVFRDFLETIHLDD